MTRMRAKLLFICVVFLVVIAILVTLSRDGYGDVWVKYDQIHEGVSKEQVEAVFGVPPGQYNRGPVEVCSTGQEAHFQAVDEFRSKSVWLFAKVYSKSALTTIPRSRAWWLRQTCMERKMFGNV